jgi:hypothetical protein
MNLRLRARQNDHYTTKEKACKVKAWNKTVKA